MKNSWKIIRLLLLLVLIGVLYGFTNDRNKKRTLTGIDVKFTDENRPFLTLSLVNKLLIQNNDSVTSITKETLVLKEIESRLQQNPMVRDAQVFITLNGELGAKIQQRKPIARVIGSGNYYIDEEGKKMPLSSVYTARVPLVSGTSKTNFSELMPLLLKLHEDEFMKKSVVGIHKNKDETIELKMRKLGFKVHFGKIKNIDRKFENFKTFYFKIKKDSLLSNYSLVNLEFGNQVVATKK